jgi:hypothetical protein
VNCRVALVLISIGMGLCPSEADAQSAAPTEQGRFELSIGALWMGGESYGSHDANLTTSTGGSIRLFSTSSELDSTAGLELRFGGRVAANIDAEVAASYTTPELRTAISADIEAAGSTVAVEPVQQFIIEGAAIIKLTRWRPRPRVLPFVTMGAGYLRQLHDAKTLVETGQTYHVGGGAKLAMVSRKDGLLKEIGLRMEARACIRSGGVALDDRAHAAAAITAALFARF